MPDSGRVCRRVVGGQPADLGGICRSARNRRSRAVSCGMGLSSPRSPHTAAHTASPELVVSRGSAFLRILGDQRHLACLPVSLRIAQARQKVIMPAKTISKMVSTMRAPADCSTITPSISSIDYSPTSRFCQPWIAPCAAIVAESLTGVRETRSGENPRTGAAPRSSWAPCPVTHGTYCLLGLDPAAGS